MSKLTEQQQEAVVSVAENVLVSAGAGSGKTHVLVERYVHILRCDPALTVDGIIAVTFTRKAAGEMRTRLKKRFKELTESESESDRWRKCLADIDSARIGTIHSLCETILKAFPAEAGIDPQFEVIDEVSQAQLLEESIDQTFREVIGGELPEIVLLSEHNIEEVRRWLSHTLASSLQFQESTNKLIPLSNEELLLALNEVRHRIQLRMLIDAISKVEWKQAYSYLAETFARDKLEQMRFQVVQSAEHIMTWSAKPDVQPDDSAEMWAHLEVVSKADLRVGGHSDEAKAVKERIGLLRSIARKLLGSPALPGTLTEEHLQSFEDERHLANLFLRALYIYSDRKKQELKLDYNDLIGLAHEALRQPDSQARKHYQDRVHAILVDEFQDTNQVQADLISSLAGQKTRLFLIGDDKQSIYKFQGADVSTFNDWKRRIAGDTSTSSMRTLYGPSKATKLTMSFRSHPSVVAFVNGVFANLLGTDSNDAPYRASFEPLVPSRKILPKQAESVAVEPSFAVPTVSFDGATVGGGASGGSSSGAWTQLSLFDNPARSATNSFMQPVIPDPTIIVGATPCVALDSNAPVQPNVEIVIFDAVDDEGERVTENSIQTESRSVAKWIHDLVERQAPLINSEGVAERPLTYGDFAVLVPKNNNFKIIEKGLAERGIPYVTFAGRGFLNRQEIIDMENLLYFLGNQLDSHALLGVLRSPMFALSDDTIHEIAVQARAEKRDPTLWQALLELVRERRPGYESVSRTVNVLKRFIDDASRFTLTNLIRSIIQKTNYDLALMSVDSGRQRSRNLWKLVSIAKEHEELTCFEFAERLTLMRDFELKQTDAPFESHDSVKLMTIHASKGLEFPAVALPCLSGKLLSQETRLIYHRNYGFALDTSRGETANRPPWFRYARQLDKDMEIAERKRLLYVAMTRARDYLGIFFEKDTGQQQESFRLWLADILEIDFHNTEATSTYTLKGTGGAAEYGITTVDRKSVIADLTAAKNVPITIDGDESDRKIKTALIDPIFPDPVSPPSPWKGWSRVTPSKDGVDGKLDATTIGVFLHSILENLPVSLQRPDENMLEALAQMLGSAVAHPERMRLLLAEGNKLLDIYYKSELFAMMKQATKRLAEVPYVMISANGMEHKRPDLILQDEHGNWLIIDYKTDDLQEEQLPAQSLRHLPQLQSYASDLAKLSGLKFEVRLYFARLGRLIDPLRLDSGKINPSDVA